MYKLIALAALAGLVVAIKMLPWWGSVALIVGLLLAGKLVFQSVVRRLFTGAFRAKSAALRGARMQLHGVESAPAYKYADVDDEDAELEPAARHWSYVDATIQVPEAPEGECRFPVWDPSELMVVPVDAKADLLATEDDDELGSVYDVSIWRDGHWVEPEDKVEGTQRVRLHVGSEAPLQRFRLRYYFELL